MLKKNGKISGPKKKLMLLMFIKRKNSGLGKNENKYYNESDEYYILDNIHWFMHKNRSFARLSFCDPFYKFKWCSGYLYGAGFAKCLQF